MPTASAPSHQVKDEPRTLVSGTCTGTTRTKQDSFERPHRIPRVSRLTAASHRCVLIKQVNRYTFSFSPSNALQAVTLALLLYTVSLYALTCMGYFQGASIFQCICLHAIPFIGLFVVATIELVLVVRSPGVVITVLALCILLPLVGGLQRTWWIQDKPSATHLEGRECTSRAVSTAA